MVILDLRPPLPFDPSGVPERLLVNSRREGGCLVWTLSCYPAGYGRIHIRRSPQVKQWASYGVHRVVLMLARGCGIGDLHVLHHCDNPPCFDLDHLFLGTPQDNMQDMLRKGRQANQNTGKDVCNSGHRLDDPENLYLSPSTQGRRICASCARESSRMGQVRRRVECKRGHSLISSVIPRDARGRRICPECRPARAATARVRNVMKARS